MTIFHIIRNCIHRCATCLDGRAAWRAEDRCAELLISRGVPMERAQRLAGAARRVGDGLSGAA